MGLFRQGGGNKPYVPHYTGLQIQTSSNAVPIPIVYGMNRVAPNLIWTGGFFAIPNPEKKGGKGGGGNQPVSYTYYTSFAMGVCEGPIMGWARIWKGQEIYGAFFVTYWWKTGITFAAPGDTPQAPWGYLLGFGKQGLSYNGTCYVGAQSCELGSTPVLPQFSFEVRGRLARTSVLLASEYADDDADPAEIIYDFLTNAQYGVGFPAASIDGASLFGSSGDASYQTYCRAAGIVMSPVLVNHETANSILEKWLKLTNSAAVWSGGKLKFIPYGDAQISNETQIGTVTFNPNVTPLYALTDDDFVAEEGRDPVEVTRVDPYSLYNWQRLTISHRGWYYSAFPIDVFDQDAIETYGLRMASEVTANEICNGNVGQRVAQLLLQRQLYIRNIYKFKLSFEYCLLEPMDIVSLTDANLGLDNTPVRITEIEEDDDGLLSVTAEEFPSGAGTAVKYPVQPPGGNTTNQGVLPGRVNTPLIFEPPGALTNYVPQVWAAVSGGIAPVYKLTEDSSSGEHFTVQQIAEGQSADTVIVFSVYAAADERSALSLEFYDGSTAKGCSFNLATALAGTPDIWSGRQLSATITDAGTAADNTHWYQCTIAVSLPVAAANLYVRIKLENPFGTQSYAGTPGDGLLFWGAAFAGGEEAQTYLPTFTSGTGATLSTYGANTPIGVAGLADPNWGGAYVWISTDNATYGLAGTVSGPARQGFLTANLPAPSGGNPDTVNILAVDLKESGGTLASASAADAASGLTLCIAGGELLSYTNAALTGTNAYNLTSLYRGLYGTAAASHSSGAPFARLDGSVFKYDLPPDYVGRTIYLKFQSFNIFGQSVEDLSECTAYSYTPNGTGLPLGPVGTALAAGTDLDYSLASEAVSLKDDFGLASSAIIATIDMGLASS
ncbi:MAG TPA: phage tail protein [Methylocella sp.]|nr:phage tail protein [Methylocella sp.]